MLHAWIKFYEWLQGCIEIAFAKKGMLHSQDAKKVHKQYDHHVRCREAYIDKDIWPSGLGRASMKTGRPPSSMGLGIFRCVVYCLHLQGGQEFLAFHSQYAPNSLFDLRLDHPTAPLPESI